MTVSTTENRKSYAGNGVTSVFSFPYVFFADADLVVLLVKADGTFTTAVLGTDYTVTGAGNDAGGSVTMTTPPASGATLVIYRDPQVTQPQAFVDNDPLPAKSISRGYDRLTVIAQRIREIANRSFRLSDADTSGASPILPTPTPNAFIGWDGLGKGLQNRSITDLITISAYGTAVVDLLTGDGTKKDFTLSANPGAIGNLDVTISGIDQTPGKDFTWDGGTKLSFTSAPAAPTTPGDTNIMARYLRALPQGTADAAATYWVDNGGASRDVASVLQRITGETVSVKDPRFGAKGDGVTDDTAAFQAAFNASQCVYVPAGNYKITATITKTSTGSFRVYGDGMGLTNILQYADADLFSIGNTGGGSGQFTVENMSLRPRASMTVGAALSFRNDTVLPSLIVSNVYIGSESTYEFKYGVKLNNCTEVLFHRVVQYGLGTANFIPWYVTSSMAATTPKWAYCAVYNARYAVQIVNTASPGIEGVQFYGCDFVAVNTGVLYQNPYGPTYLPPQIAWFGGHMHATGRNFDLTNCSQVIVNGALLYNSGTGPFMNINTCSDLQVTGNKFISIGSGSAIGMDIYTNADPINGGLIAANSFSLNGSVQCININASRIIQNLKITGNQRVSGSKTVNVSAGYLDNSVELSGNTQDSEDVYGTITVTGSTTGLGGQRADFFLVNASPNATITQLFGRKPSETITLKSDDPTLKIQHNGLANGFILKGGVDFSFSSGANITLRKANGGYWTEVARSV